MGCCFSCLSSCCCTQAGLRCHSVISICGAFFFLLMFVLFDRQEAFFEFEMTDPSGIKWTCLWTALFWLFLFFVAMIRLMEVNRASNRNPSLGKISLTQLRTVRGSVQQTEQKAEQQRLLRQK